MHHGGRPAHAVLQFVVLMLTCRQLPGCSSCLPSHFTHRPLQVASGSEVCHDASSLLAVHFPYAAPKPASCDAKIVITPLTTLLTHGNIGQAALLKALSLPEAFALLSTDSLDVSWRGGGAPARAGRLAS